MGSLSSSTRVPTPYRVPFYSCPCLSMVLGGRGRLWHGGRIVVAHHDLAGFILYCSRIYTRVSPKYVVSIDVIE